MMESIKIPLTQGQFAVIDADDYERVSVIKWRSQWCENTKSFYAHRTERLPMGKRVAVGMHRFIMNAASCHIVDHINHDTLDNRKCNLRICNSRQNSFNRRANRNNSSGFKGVSRSKIRGRETWIASIKRGGKQICLGYFDDIKDAARAYDDEAAIVHGEFAVLNFPKETVGVESLDDLSTIEALAFLVERLSYRICCRVSPDDILAELAVRYLEKNQLRRVTA
jgi:hypothetical protein